MSNENIFENYFEIRSEDSISYILKNNNDFSITQFKVVKSQQDYLIKCSKVIFNGNIKLIYFVNGFKSLYSLLSSIDSNQFYTIIKNILLSIVKMKKNGFLTLKNTLLSLDSIYIDPKTFSVKFVYLPIDCITNNYDPERTLFNELAKIITSFSMFSTNNMMKLCRLLSNENYSANQILETMDYTDISSKAERQTILLFNSKTLNINFKIKNEEFIIGRNSNLVDGALKYYGNERISRKHCKIKFDGHDYYIVDLGSTYGTFVNDAQVPAGKEFKLADGDKVKLANSVFDIIIQEV